jgi:hypothetical protein
LLVATAAVLILGAGLLLRRERSPSAARPQPTAAASAVAVSGRSASASAKAAARPFPLPVPRLLTAIAAPEIPTGNPWQGADEVSAQDRQALATLDRQARGRALAALALSPEQAIRVAEIHGRSDARLEELEAQMAAELARDPEAPVNIRRFRADAASELNELEALLGPQQARLFRETERRHYRALFSQSFPEPNTAVRNAGQRRSMWLRWDPASVVHVAEGSPPPG